MTLHLEGCPHARSLQSNSVLPFSTYAKTTTRQHKCDHVNIVCYSPSLKALIMLKVTLTCENPLCR